MLRILPQDFKAVQVIVCLGGWERLGRKID
jgi:hypothetical protein